MLWNQYVFRRGGDLHDTWDALYNDRHVSVLYIAGRGFDTRAQTVMREFVGACKLSAREITNSELLLVDLLNFQLTHELSVQTDLNASEMENIFRVLGPATRVDLGSAADEEDSSSAGNILRRGCEAVLQKVSGHTDIILDVSSLPRVIYLALLTGLLQKLVPDKDAPNALFANGINFQVLVGEDATLDGYIVADDPSNDLVFIPGFSSVLQAESFQEWPLVWFPILGENRINQLQKVAAVIPDSAEICPVLPHPSRDLRRADRLLVEYRGPLFDSRETPTTNILYVHEAHPFEAYRQLLGAMKRYRNSMGIVGGCRLVVTPLGSKLITIGAGLSCFEMRPSGTEANYGVAIPYAQPMRYDISRSKLHNSKPEVCALLLTGSAYDTQRRYLLSLTH